MNSLKEKEFDFNSLEKEVFNYVCKLGVEIIKNVLESLDKSISEERNKTEYRHKGLKQNSIKTLMGTVEYQRAIYQHIDESGNKEHTYLLDKYMKMKTIGKMSGMLIEKVLENVSNVSYRKSAENVTSITGQSISHGAVWDIVQNFGEKLESEEEVNVKRFKEGNLQGEKIVDVLFMESDGLWLSMQRKDRPKKGRGGKREIKIGLHYEGWIERNSSGKSFLSKNKEVVAGFTDSENFKLLRDASIAKIYNYDEIKFKILNGDGATWIKKDHDAEGEYFQLDRFHISKAILRNIKDKDESKKLWKMFKKSEFECFKLRLNELKYECGGVYEEVKKIEELEKYLISNKDGIIPYKNRVNLPEPERGLYYRNMGIMEPNVYNILGHRMKGRKMSWSIKGANHIAKILAVKISGKLYDKIGTLLSFNLPEKATEVYETVISNVKKNEYSKLKNKKLYPIHGGKIPFTDVAVTAGRKAIKNMLKDRPCSELIYR